jgi:hypothetical protein
MTRGGRGREAELYVIRRINELPGWSADDAYDPGLLGTTVAQN